MATKDVWANAIEEKAFREDTCRRCFQVDETILRETHKGEGCPHLLRAADNKLPKVWVKRRGNDAVLGKTYKCADKLDQPAVVRRKTSPADTPAMFDVEPSDADFVPIEGWPTAEDFGRKTKKEDDHQ